MSGLNMRNNIAQKYNNMEIRVWKSKNRSKYKIVYRDEQTGKLHVTNMDGSKCVNEKAIIKGYESHNGGLWASCRDMGKTIEDIRSAVEREIAEDEAQREREELQAKAEIEARAKALEEAKAARDALVGTKGSITVKPIEVMQTYDLLEERLEVLRPGEYAVCINYKKLGSLELRAKARESDHLKVLTMVTKDEKFSKASLHRFAIAVRKAYESGINIIGKTHALKSFGKKIVDAAPFIQEKKNPYFSSAAPRRYYDKNTLIYMQLEQMERNDN